MPIWKEGREATLEVASHSGIDTLAEVVHVTGVQASHRNSAIGSHEDVGLLSESLGLLRLQASETITQRNQHKNCE